MSDTEPNTETTLTPELKAELEGEIVSRALVLYHARRAISTFAFMQGPAFDAVEFFYNASLKNLLKAVERYSVQIEKDTRNPDEKEVD